MCCARVCTTRHRRCKGGRARARNCIKVRTYIFTLADNSYIHWRARATTICDRNCCDFYPRYMLCAPIVVVSVECVHMCVLCARLSVCTYYINIHACMWHVCAVYLCVYIDCTNRTPRVCCDETRDTQHITIVVVSGVYLRSRVI